MTTTPRRRLSTWSALRAIAFLALRRQLNAFVIAASKKKRTKLILPILLGFFFFVGLPLQGVFFAYNMVDKIAIATAEIDDGIMVSWREQLALRHFTPNNLRPLEAAIGYDLRFRAPDGSLNAEGLERLDALLEFSEKPGFNLPRRYFDAGQGIAMGRPHRHAEHLLSLVVLVGFLGVLFMSMGIGMVELGKVSWTFEWLHTFPVSSRTLVLAKIFEYSFINLGGWLFIVPFFLTVFFRWNDTAAAFPAAICAALFLLTLYGSIRAMTENLLRRFVSAPNLKTLQAVVSLIGLLLMFVVMATAQPGALSGESLKWFLQFDLTLLDLIPTSWVFLFPFVGNWQWLLWGIAIAGTALVSASASAWALRHGLVASTTHLVANEAQRERERARPPRILGVVRKEALRLVRDKNFAVGTLLVPLVIMGFQLVMGNKFFFGRGAKAWGPTIAFGVCAYSLVFSTITAVAHEGKALWMNYTFPRPVHEIFRQRGALWGGIFTAYVLVIASILNTVADNWEVSTVVGTAMAMVGIVVHAYMGIGIGLLGTRIVRGGPHRAPVRPMYSYLFLGLAANYGFALATGSPWNVFAAFIIAIAITDAIWTRAELKIRYLFDQDDIPTQPLDLLDTLLGLATFFVVQSVIIQIVNAGGANLDVAVPISYFAAGALAVALMAWVSRHRQPREVQASATGSTAMPLIQGFRSDTATRRRRGGVPALDRLAVATHHHWARAFVVDRSTRGGAGAGVRRAALSSLSVDGSAAATLRSPWHSHERVVVRGRPPAALLSYGAPPRTAPRLDLHPECPARRMHGHARSLQRHRRVRGVGSLASRAPDAGGAFDPPAVPLTPLSELPTSERETDCGVSVLFGANTHGLPLSRIETAQSRLRLARTPHAKLSVARASRLSIRFVCFSALCAPRIGPIATHQHPPSR